MYDSENPAYRITNEYVPTLGGQVVEVDRVKARHLTEGDKVVVMYDANHRHPHTLDQCGPYRKAGLFQVYDFDSMSDPTPGAFGAGETIRGVYLRDADGNRRMLGHVNADRWIRVLAD